MRLGHSFDGVNIAAQDGNDPVNAQIGQGLEGIFPALWRPHGGQFDFGIVPPLGLASRAQFHQHGGQFVRFRARDEPAVAMFGNALVNFAGLPPIMRGMLGFCPDICVDRG